MRVLSFRPGNLSITIFGNANWKLHTICAAVSASPLIRPTTLTVSFTVEGDNLPGLVIDVYAKTAVMQAHSAGMHVDRMTIAEALSEVMGDKIENIYYKSETTLPFKADLFPEKRLF